VRCNVEFTAKPTGDAKLFLVKFHERKKSSTLEISAKSAAWITMRMDWEMKTLWWKREEVRG
jgi:hypothetical protein